MENKNKQPPTISRRLRRSMLATRVSTPVCDCVLSVAGGAGQKEQEKGQTESTWRPSVRRQNISNLLNALNHLDGGVVSETGLQPSLGQSQTNNRAGPRDSERTRTGSSLGDCGGDSEADARSKISRHGNERFAKRRIFSSAKYKYKPKYRQTNKRTPSLPTPMVL